MVNCPLAIVSSHISITKFSYDQNIETPDVMFTPIGLHNSADTDGYFIRFSLYECPYNTIPRHSYVIVL